jgi:hypothetical protein
MTAEVRAPAGRSVPQIFERLRAQGLFGPGVPYRVAKDDPGDPFLRPDDRSVTPPPGTWATDQETVIAAEGARVEGDTLRADAVRVSLPEGSGLRIVLEGRVVAFEPGAAGRNRIRVTSGTVRIVDEAGVTRIRANAASHAGEATLTLTGTSAAGAVGFTLAADDGFLPIAIRVDTATGVPAGERQPPHGAVRWKLLAPPAGPGASELKMQWIYDLSQLHRPDDC